MLELAYLGYNADDQRFAWDPGYISWKHVKACNLF